MKKTITIRDVDDLYERYKMPDLEFRNKDQGKYHTTYVTNLPKICKAIHIDHHIVSKFFGWKLKTQAKYDDNTNELQMKGSFEYDKLLTTLRDFINTYVLCTECTYPELDFIVKKNKLGTMCRACGHRTVCDLNDRIYKLLLQEVANNPKHYQKIVPKSKSLFENIDVDEKIDAVVEWDCDVSDKAVQKRRKEMEGQSDFMKSLFR